MTTAEWVRQALRAARRGELTTEAKTKLGAVRAAVRNAFPIADIDRLLAEIETGYSGPPPE